MKVISQSQVTYTSMKLEDGSAALGNCCYAHKVSTPAIQFTGDGTIQHPMSIQFSPELLAAILTGLRLVQQGIAEGMLEEMDEYDILTDGGTLEPPTLEDLNAYCELLNL